MTDQLPHTGGSDRKARLAEELRANLQKRKAQVRARRAGEADKRPAGLDATRTQRAQDKQ